MSEIFETIQIMRKNLGPVTAYKYAVSQGYTGTEQEFAALMASYATVAQEAEAAKDDAVDAKTAAEAAQAAAEAAQAAAEAAAEQAEGAIEVDDTLSVKGRAADAKVVGDEIEEIAAFEHYPNLFNKDEVVLNKLLEAGSGKTYESIIDYDGLSVSPIIPVESGMNYTGSGLLTGNSAKIFQYNQNGAYIGGSDGTRNDDGTFTYTMGETGKFIRFRYTTGFLNINTYMFVKGNSVPAEYVPYGKYLSGGELYDTKQELSESIEAIDLKTDDALIRNILYKVPNTIDYSAFTQYAFVNGNTGELTTNESYTNFWCSDYTPVIPNGTYYYSTSIYLNGHLAFYDKNKNYISGYESTVIPNPFTVPSDAEYVRFLVVSASNVGFMKAWLNIINEAPDETTVKYAFNANTALAVNVENPCDYNGDEITVFNKIMCIGDSITQGTFNHNEGGTMQYINDVRYAYPTYLTKLCGVETYNNGVGGYTSVQWWNSKQSSDFSGYDCAIINLGINDALQGVSSADTTTAITNIINALRAANNGIKIFVATIVPAYSDGTTVYDAINETIRDVAEENNCYLIDLSRYSHARKATVCEAGHLSAWGYYRLAKDYISAISYIMSKNRSGFKLIQFIGTEYSYS